MKFKYTLLLNQIMNFILLLEHTDGKNKLLLQDESEIVADQYTSDEIIGMFIDQIKEYHSKVD